MSGLFDGPGAAIVGRIMAKRNAEAEAEAVQVLAPAADAEVLVLGYGPGVGVALLADRVPLGRVVGVDPSRAMLKMAKARNRAAVAEGRVILHLGLASAVPSEPEAFDGAIAVNTFQLCEPLAETARDLARVLRPGALFVSLTHDWAAAKHAGTAEAWIQQAVGALEESGFKDILAKPARAEGGGSIALTARRGG